MGTNDPIGRMFKRGELRRETDRDGKAAEARLKAARMWQSIYADLPGAQLNSEKRKAAQAMSRLEDQLGEYRSLLLRRVLGEKLELDAVASLMLGDAARAGRSRASPVAHDAGWCERQQSATAPHSLR